MAQEHTFCSIYREVEQRICHYKQSAFYRSHVATSKQGRLIKKDVVKWEKYLEDALSLAIRARNIGDGSENTSISIDPLINEIHFLLNMLPAI